MSVNIVCGDALEKLTELSAGSVNCCVTSPPYYGLRDYGTARQLGLEATPDEYVAKMVAVFREVRRVLRDDGTLWLNIGDSYSSGGRATYRSGASDNKGQLVQNDLPRPIDAPGIKPKDLLGIPWMLAFALRADGWYLRQDIIWSKPNPMPESVSDRPTKAHEYLFLLSKSARYYYDAVAIKQPMKDVSLQRLSQPNVFDQPGGPKDPKIGNRSHRKAINNQAERLVKHEKWKTRFEGWDEYDKSLGRNARSVWEIATAPFPEAHFATFPPALVEPCILAGTSEKGCCPTCGAPWQRLTERVDQGYDGSKYGERAVSATGGAKSGGTAASTLGSSNGTLVGWRKTLSWEPTCKCPRAEPVPCNVLDPFSGSGTTGLVADRLGRNAILIELNPTYAQMARRRIENDAPLFAQVVNS